MPIRSNKVPRKRVLPAASLWVMRVIRVREARPLPAVSGGLPDCLSRESMGLLDTRFKSHVPYVQRFA